MRKVQCPKRGLNIAAIPLEDVAFDAAFFWIVEDYMAKVVSFFKDCARELRLVVWPTREQVWSSVKVVVVSTIIVSIILGALDLGFTALFRLLMK